MSDVVWFAYMALQAGYVLGRVRPFERWRVAAERHLRFSDWERLPRWRWWLLAGEHAVTHPVRSWRALRRSS